MVVCKFFQQGRCKFGTNCRNEHPTGQQSGGGAFGNTSSAFGASRPAGGSAFGNISATFGGFGAGRGRAGAPAASGTGLNMLAAGVENGGRGVAQYPDGLAWNSTRSGQIELSVDTIKATVDPRERPLWRGSGFGPAKYEPNILPGLDTSPEELRVAAYTARASASMAGQDPSAAQPVVAAQENEVFSKVDQALAGVQSDPVGAFQQVLSNRQNALNADKTFLQSIGVPLAGTSAGQTSGFGGASAPNTGSAFGATAGPTSAFGKSAAFGQTSAFGAQSQPANTSAFGAPAAFGQTSTVGAPPRSANASFGQTSGFGAAPSGGAFGQPSGFGQSNASFGKTSGFGAAPAQGSGFGQSSGFGAAPKPATGGAFGQTASFGQPSGFGQTSAFGAKPAAATPNTSAFGQQGNTSTSAFGAFGKANAFGQTNSFGAKPAPAASAFGAPAASSQPAPAFGAASSSTSAFNTAASQKQPALGAFGAPAAPTPSSGPGPAAATGGDLAKLPKMVQDLFTAPDFEWGKIPAVEPPMSVR